MVHTRIQMENNTPDPENIAYKYTLYSALGEPIEKIVTAKDAYYLQGTQLGDAVGKYGVVDGFTRLNRYSFYCIPDNSAIEGTFKQCKGIFTFSPYVNFTFEVSFGKPATNDNILIYFKDLYQKIRPVFLEGKDGYVKTPTDISPYVEDYDLL